MKKTIRYYFVDEAGDGTVFNQLGKLIVGTEGCSKYFMLGFVDIKNPDLLTKELSHLKDKLLSDPYFSKIPSMQASRNKTAVLFHAKDDIPEVRREVFSILVKQDIRFFASIKDKRKVFEYIRQRNTVDKEYRYTPNELYDLSAQTLFSQALHKEDGYEICFSRRGSSDRTKSLEETLIQTRNKFCLENNIQKEAVLKIKVDAAKNSAGLQAADYYLWALQRLYEKQEDRYLDYLAHQIGVIIDIDDQSNQHYGEFYTRKNPLTLDKIKKRSGI